MIVSRLEFDAIIVALRRAGMDFMMAAPSAIMTAEQKEQALRDGAFGVECMSLCARFTDKRSPIINGAAEREIVIAALRHMSKLQIDISLRERNAFEIEKRRHYAASFAQLSDRLFAEMRGN